MAKLQKQPDAPFGTSLNSRLLQVLLASEQAHDAHFLGEALHECLSIRAANIVKRIDGLHRDTVCAAFLQFLGIQSGTEESAAFILRAECPPEE